MEIYQEEEVVIVGAGIAGLATALALKRVGIRALVLERSHELRATGAALTLAPNAWVALHALGVAHKLTSIYAPFTKGFVTNLANGSVQEISFGEQVERNGNGARSVHRKALLEALTHELPTDTIRFDSKLRSIETHTHEGSSLPILHMEDGSIIKAKVLIGCDGVHSVVAKWLGLSKPVHSGRFAVRGLAVMPEAHGLNNQVQFFLVDGRKAGLTHLTDNEAYWFLTSSSTLNEEEGMKAGDPELIQKKVLESLANFPPMLSEFVKHSDLTTLSWAPFMLRLPWNLVFARLSIGNVTVAGDAMHPMTPDLGQGGCAALEDAVVLGRYLGTCFLKHKRIEPAEATEALKLYVKERRWRAIGLIIGSYFSGWVQQGGHGWLASFIRDSLFYRFIFKRIVDVIKYDCGKLPCEASSTEVNDHRKTE